MGRTDTNGTVFAFSIDRASRLTGLSITRLREWDESGLYTPEFADEERGQAYSQLYSFQDIVGLRTLAQLRKRGVPLRELKKLGDWLRLRYDRPWASLRFYLLGRRVLIDDPELGHKVVQPGGQLPLITFELEAIARETREAVEQLRERDPENVGRIARHRHVMSNTPVIAGTRIPTAAIWDYHEAGYDATQILHEYPHLSFQDVEAAISDELRRRKHAG